MTLNERKAVDKMKYVVILGDGMADLPIDELGGKTPLEKANKPTFDMFASCGEMGMVKTVPDGIKPGSDVANLSVMGYDPKKYYTGRSPLEAVSIGVDLKDDDITYRVNTVTLSDEDDYAKKTMVDYSADEISSAEGKELMEAMNKEFADENIHFYAGTSYRNLMVVHHGKTENELTAPHDISKRVIGEYLPKGTDSEMFLNMMKKSYEMFENHPVNIKRSQKGLNKANSVWFWGMGSKPILTSFEEKYGLKGAVISAVDLLKGIGISAKMKVVEVKGATGNVDTNFEGKALAAADVLLNGGCDFVYVHVEAPDECGHRAEIENKVLSIEKLDAMTKLICDKLDEAGEEYNILVMPDHPTPIKTMTHSGEPVPYVIYQKGAKKVCDRRYTEAEAKKTDIFRPVGCELMKDFLK